MNAMRTVTINWEHDGITETAGDGRYNDGQIVDCEADLGTDVYDALEDALDDADEDSAGVTVTVAGAVYHALVEDAAINAQQ